MLFDRSFGRAGTEAELRAMRAFARQPRIRRDGAETIRTTTVHSGGRSSEGGATLCGGARSARGLIRRPPPRSVRPGRVGPSLLCAEGSLTRRVLRQHRLAIRLERQNARVPPAACGPALRPAPCACVRRPCPVARRTSAQASYLTDGVTTATQTGEIADHTVRRVGGRRSC